jgi:hypothetical protein
VAKMHRAGMFVFCPATNQTIQIIPTFSTVGNTIVLGKKEPPAR